MRDAYETWGYVNKITTEEDDIYTPVTLAVVSTKQDPAAGLIVMEDTDVNQDMIPDCLQDMTGWDFVDTDGDGISDDDEQNEYGTDPFKADTDGDGLSDYEEIVVHFTDPCDPDSDGDEMADGREVAIGTNPCEADADADADFDGLTNEQECKALEDLGLALRADNPETVAGTPDYFAKGTKSVKYAGEFYNGAEWIEATMRTTLGMAYLSKAGTRDYNSTGWDYWNWAYGTSYSVGDWLPVSTNITGYTELLRRQNAGEIEFRKDYSYIGSTYTFNNELYTIEYREIKTLDETYAPQPTFNVTLKYGGNADKAVIVEAYQINSAYPEKGEQMVASWTTTAAFKAGVAKVSLGAPAEGNGRLGQGYTRFYAYIEGDKKTDVNSAEASAYGYAERNVGFEGGEMEITLGTPNAALPVIDLDSNSSSNSTETAATAPVQSVAIVRTAVNGEKLEKPRGVYVAYFPNNVARTRLYPSDFVRKNFVGVDRFLAADYGEDELARIESVEYAVIDGKDRPYDSENWTSNQIDTITFNYSDTRDKARLNLIADALESNATLSFDVPTDTANTKFWLKVNGKVYGGTTGYTMPYSAAGTVTVRFADHPEIGNLVIGKGNTFAVALGNDKYGYPAAGDFCAAGTQYVGKDSVRDAGFTVTVKHPTATAADFAAGKMVVAAYESADLAEPVAWTSGAFGKAFALTNLVEGKSYYLAAWYVRNAKDGRAHEQYRQPYDTWGYVANLGTNATCFAARAVKAKANGGAAETIWLQDTFYNGNLIVDREEEMTAIVDVDNATDETDPTADWDEDELPDPIDPDPVFPDEEDDDDEYIRIQRGDLMAYKDIDVQFVAIGTDGIETNWTWYAVMDIENEAKGIRGTDGLIYKQTPATSIMSAATTYEYGLLTGVGTNVTFTAADGTVRAAEFGKVRLVHAQVFAYCGFNTATASRTAYLAGEGVDTKPFTRADKFLVPKYLHAIGMTGIDPTNYFGKAVEYETVAPFYAKIRTDKKEWNLFLNDRSGASPADADGDDIADGWELYTMFGIESETAGVSQLKDFMANPFAKSTGTTLAGAKISPFNAADAQQTSPGDVGLTGTSKIGESVALKLVEEFDHGYWPTDPWRTDTDNDNVIDYYAYRYHLKADDAGEDWDDLELAYWEADVSSHVGDGLCNYSEYLITEVFNFAVVDPDKSKTNGSVCDYFRKKGELYLGEMFQDHDQVNDQWEQDYETAANRYVYDPSRDDDGDGWSNYAEAKAGTHPGVVASPGVDGEVLPEYPNPTIEADVVYSGKQELSGSLVFQAWSTNDTGMAGQPDAVWTAMSEGSATNVTKYVGQNPGKEITYQLGPGVISRGSVKIRFLDTEFEKAKVENGIEVSSYRGEVGDAQWYNFIQDYNGDLYTTAITNGVLSLAATQVKVGTVDYAMGKMTIDFSSPALQQCIYQNAVNGTSNETDNDTNITSLPYTHEKLDLSRSYVKLEWKPVKIVASGNATYCLSNATGGKGHVREGMNKFVVFCDEDEDGAYTPGEPFGFVRNVDVGWQGGKFTVELTETSPVFARIDLRATDFKKCTDRQVWQEGASTVTDISDDKYSELCKTLGITWKDGDEGLDLSSTRLTRIRVMRVMVNGEASVGYDEDGINHLAKQVILDKYLDLGTRSYLHEGDFLTGSAYDADWLYLPNTVCNIDTKPSNDDCDGYTFQDPTNVTYAIVMGEGDVGNSSSNLVFRCLVDKTFDYAGGRLQENGQPATTLVIRPVIDPVTPQDEVYGARPTFRFAMRDGYGNNYDSYTAFNIKITGGGVTYETGLRDLPACDGNGWYEWTLDEAIGTKLPASGNYTWQVALYNAKFQGARYRGDNYNGINITEWSESGTFTVNMNNQQEMNDHGYSSIGVAVKYAGPSAVLKGESSCSYCGGSSSGSKIIVQAFATADFAGNPMGQSYVDADDVAVTEDEVSIAENAVIKGLPATGTYYLRAFIDTNGSGRKDIWESWGASAEPVVLTTACLVHPTVAVWIEDADTDGDWIPDAYEMVTKGNLTTLDGKIIDDDKIVFSSTVAAYSGSAGISTGLEGASLTVFQNSSIVNTLLGNDLGTTVSINAIRAAVEKKVIEPNSVKITALTLQPDGKSVTLSLEADVSADIAGEILGKLYDMTATKDYATVTVKVYKKTTLAEAGWTLVSTTTENVGKTATEVEVPVSGIEMTSGFYKIEVVQ